MSVILLNKKTLMINVNLTPDELILKDEIEQNII